MCLLWNLQTLILKGLDKLVIAPSEIWQMSQLRHLYLWKLCLPDPPSVEEEKSVVVLRNLRTLLRIKNFKCGEDVVNRIPNIKNLRVFYKGPDEGSGRESLINLGRLTKLESFFCTFNSTEMPFLQNITFPHSLRKLTLMRTFLDWEEMSTTIGSLPLLQELILGLNACKGSKWEPVEEQFCSLKFLVIDGCSSQFTPLGGVISVKKIADEQEELGNVDLQVQVFVRSFNATTTSFSIPKCLRFGVLKDLDVKICISGHIEMFKCLRDGNSKSFFPLTKASQ
ncbi:hypothetical protein BUALT_Bualt12G0037700 [Buddleja alternifolia]|uniref:RGC2-like protein n=1 Tax=Buddleja alternifolia TaxID=168488 RepID=A0AAV6WMA9_9LAMI|nr:hypothetical protein BUALT_Bualt12G0037700 [Buddleja alternifolia]